MSMIKMPMFAIGIPKLGLVDGKKAGDSAQVRSRMIKRIGAP